MFGRTDKARPHRLEAKADPNRSTIAIKPSKKILDHRPDPRNDRKLTQFHVELVLSDLLRVHLHQFR
jgi:hypothetical protein